LAQLVVELDAVQDARPIGQAEDVVCKQVTVTMTNVPIGDT
jgi:hypothetical protein